MRNLKTIEHNKKENNKQSKKYIGDIKPDVHKGIKQLAVDKDITLPDTLEFLLGYYRSTNPASKIEPENFERDLEKEQEHEQEQKISKVV